jgi:hypothetical protein
MNTVVPAPHASSQSAGQDHCFVERPTCRHSSDSKVVPQILCLPGFGGLQSRPHMNYWYYFWIANFILAGSAFAVITVIVLVRGLGDLRQMLANLRAEVRRPQ